MQASNKSQTALIKFGNLLCLHCFKTSYDILAYPLGKAKFQSYYSVWNLIFVSLTLLITALSLTYQFLKRFAFKPCKDKYVFSNI